VEENHGRSPRAGGGPGSTPDSAGSARVMAGWMPAPDDEGLTPPGLQAARKSAATAAVGRAGAGAGGGRTRRRAVRRGGRTWSSPSSAFRRGRAPRVPRPKGVLAGARPGMVVVDMGRNEAKRPSLGARDYCQAAKAKWRGPPGRAKCSGADVGRPRAGVSIMWAGGGKFMEGGASLAECMGRRISTRAAPRRRASTRRW